jgi:tRNA(Arg) A34 adenosine deaminase TadA
MELTYNQRKILKDLMTRSALKGNLANAGIALSHGKTIAAAESWVVSSCDATAHSERMLVEMVGKLKHNHFTSGISIVSVIEPCLMCISACSQGGIKTIGYIIPAKKYIKKIPWMSDTQKVDKEMMGSNLSNPIKLIYLGKYSEEFCEVFEKSMAQLLKPKST